MTEINDVNSEIKENVFKDHEIDFFYLIGVLYRYWKILFIISTVVSVSSIVYVLVATPIYKSVITMYPVTKDQGGPLKELAVTLGMSSKNDGFYLNEVLKSRRISKKVIYKKYLTENNTDSINLIQFFGFNEFEISENRKFEATLKALQAAVEIRDDKETGLVSVTVSTKDKKLCRDIANYYSDAVTEYLLKEERNQITQSIIFTRDRLEEVRKELEDAENELVRFQETNVKTSSPYLSVESKRKYKKIEIIQNVVILLEKQIELLKIEEVREKPVVNVLDVPDLYDKPVIPQRRRVVTVNALIAFLGTYVLLILREKAIKHNVKNILLKELRKPKA